MADLYGTYDKRIKFTIDNTKIDATLTWIPITVLLTSTAGEEVFVELSDFNRCAFTKADEATELYADCEYFDVSEEVAIYHVSRDGWEIASGTDTDFYMYYDDDASPNTTYISASGGTAAQSVYDANFKTVYHMHSFNNYDTRYEGAVEPDSDGWTLGGTDYSSSDGDILTIDTSANDTYTCYYYKTPDVDFNAGFYLKMRVKASTDMDDVSDALLIQIQDGTQNEQFKMWIRDGEVSYFHEPNTTVDIAMDTTTAYVTYDIYIKGSTFYIYADGVLKGANTVDAATVTDLVQFGDPLGSPTMCKAEIDYVYYALGVTANPLLTIYDSTSNNNDGTKKGLGEPVEAAGKVGLGQDFDGDDHIDCGALTLGLSDAYTLEAIVIAGGTGTIRSILGKDDSDGNRDFQFRVDDEDILQFIRFGTTDNLIASLKGSTDITDSAYYHLCGVFDDGTGSAIYVDGSSEDTDIVTTANNNTAEKLIIGARDISALDNYHDDIIDEVRVSSTNRAAAWVKATYNTLFDTLLTYGNEETSGVVVDNAIFFGCNF